MKRIFACLFIVAALPLLTSTTQSISNNAAPLTTTVFAGHVIGGSWCECGTPGCICDPGEQPINSATAPSGLSSNGHQTAAPGLDAASALMVGLLAFLLWLKLL